MPNSFLRKICFAVILAVVGLRTTAWVTKQSGREGNDANGATGLVARDTSRPSSAVLHFRFSPDLKGQTYGLKTALLSGFPNEFGLSAEVTVHRPLVYVLEQAHVCFQFVFLVLMICGENLLRWILGDRYYFRPNIGGCCRSWYYFLRRNSPQIAILIFLILPRIFPRILQKRNVFELYLVSEDEMANQTYYNHLIWKAAHTPSFEEVGPKLASIGFKMKEAA